MTLLLLLADDGIAVVIPDLESPTFTIRKGATRTRGSYNQTYSRRVKPTRTVRT